VEISELIQAVENELNKEPERPPDSYTTRELREHFQVSKYKMDVILNQMLEEEKLEEIQIPIKSKTGHIRWVRGWILKKA
jgi:hypothetical protein